MSRFVVQQERDRVARRRLLVVFFAALAIGTIAVLSARWLLHAFSEGPLGPARPPPHAPAQIATVEQTLVRDTARGLVLREKQRAALEQWAWVDRDAGVAQIPIDVAMDLVARQAADAAAEGAE